MNFLNNEDGVSEVIGALLIFLILVVVLGSIQVYEVPKWNKELERQNFDIVSAEFIDMKSDLEDVSSQFVPRTSALHMGVKYPERFMLRNPGPAYGTLSTYPLNITVNITLSDYSGGNITYNETKYTSNGIEYKLNGLSNFPKLVYEHGLIIKNFGVANLTDTTQSLLIRDEIFIPIVNGSSITLSSAETASLNLKPLEMSIFNTTNSTTGMEFNITRINITMDTKYYKTWNETFNDTNVRVEGNKINISIPGSISSSKKYFVYPTKVPYQDSIYFGMLKFTSNPNALKGLKGDTGERGPGSGGGGANCYDAPGIDPLRDGVAGLGVGDCVGIQGQAGSTGVPPFTTINISLPNYSVIRDIIIDIADNPNLNGNERTNYKNTHANITATVTNVTDRTFIHADLTGLTRNSNPMMYDVNPDIIIRSYPNKTLEVKWSNIEHQEFPSVVNYPVIIPFWVDNKQNGLYFTLRTFIHQSGGSGPWIN